MYNFAALIILMRCTSIFHFVFHISTEAFMDEDKKPTGKRFRRMENISSVFSSSDLNHRLFGHEGFQFFLFQKRWEKLVGQVMAKESYVSSYKNDMLFVTVTNSVFLQQLYVIKNDILSRLSEDEFGKQFTDIRFIAGPRKKKYQTFTTLDPINRAIEKEQRMYDQPLTDKETDWIRHWVSAHIEKEALQAPFSDMMKAVLQIRKGELAAGYHPCQRCGALTPPDTSLCSSCERKNRQEKRALVIELLRKNPHFTFQEVTSRFPCTYPLYESCVNQLIHRYKERIFHQFARPDEKRRLLALLTHRPIESMTDQEAEEALKKLPKKSW